MESNQCIGLIKFFRNEEFLDKLISGCFHCTPPEIYRMSKQEGVSDKFESCSFSFRKERGDEQVVIEFDGFGLKEKIKESDASSMTLHNGSKTDSWMHCWFCLRLPSDQDALESLKSDIQRMKDQFGSHYAFIINADIEPFIERLKKLSKKELTCGEVEYCGDRSRWGNLCKSVDYSYQREFRFLFGECSTSETDYYIFNNPETFSDVIHKNPDLKLQDKGGECVWFDLKN